MPGHFLEMEMMTITNCFYFAFILYLFIFREGSVLFKFYGRKIKLAGEVAQLVVCLPSKHEAQSSNPSTTKRNK
jgi:hypothetical protein